MSFRSDAQAITGHVDPVEESAGVDLFCDGAYQGSAELSGLQSFSFGDLLPGEKLIELWLPQFGEFRLRSLELNPGASIGPHQDTRPKWLTYGSSITHCRTAERPSETWPAIVARKRGFNLTCLGYGGQCQMDTMVALMIRDLDFDFLSLKLGINTYEANSFNFRTFAPGIIGFVRGHQRKASRHASGGDFSHNLPAQGDRPPTASALHWKRCGRRWRER